MQGPEHGGGPAFDLDAVQGFENDERSRAAKHGREPSEPARARPRAEGHEQSGASALGEG